MIGGVNFQPGLQDSNDPRMQGERRPGGSSQGVQDAIKVLSLRLPKVVGAQAVAPSALLNAPGAAGNPHIDSIVENVLRKFFPGGRSGAQAPMVPTPDYRGMIGQAYGEPVSGTLPIGPGRPHARPQPPQPPAQSTPKYPHFDFEANPPGTPPVGAQVPAPDVDVWSQLDWVPPPPEREDFRI